MDPHQADVWWGQCSFKCICFLADCHMQSSPDGLSIAKHFKFFSLLTKRGILFFQLYKSNYIDLLKYLWKELEWAHSPTKMLCRVPSKNLTLALPLSGAEFSDSGGLLWWLFTYHHYVVASTRTTAQVCSFITSGKQPIRCRTQIQ